ncbi:MAG: hypothetical protein DRQ61_11390 [Gammaproteobacteria bacterium]|nr:MAG: hypothetical protein DRQ61_11390 [Gammaproteobacteria bacterium]
MLSQRDINRDCSGGQRCKLGYTGTRPPPLEVVVRFSNQKESVAVLARRYGVTEPTIRTWKNRKLC